MELLAVAALLLSTAATVAPEAISTADEEILDHRGQWGLSAAIGATFVTDSRPLTGASGYSPGLVPHLEVDLGQAIDERDEWHLRVRLLDDPYLRPWFLAGYRVFSGEGPLTTDFDFAAVWITGHDWALGARGALGLVWDPVRWGGLFLQLGVTVAVGATFDVDVDGEAGAQLRW